MKVVQPLTKSMARGYCPALLSALIRWSHSLFACMKDVKVRMMFIDKEIYNRQRDR